MNATLYFTNDTRNEWVKCRAAGFGSSEVGTLMGVNPYTSKRDCVARKIEARKGNFEYNENNATRWGHLLEDVVAKEALNDPGSMMQKPLYGGGIAVGWGGWDAENGEQVTYIGEQPYERATPDRIVNIAGGKQAVMEIKTTTLDLSKPGECTVEVVDNNGEAIYVPTSWFYQVQWEMYCTGLGFAFLAILQLTTRKLHVCGIARSADTVINDMRGVVKNCWEMVLREELPEPTTLGDLAKCYPSDNGEVVESDSTNLLQTYEDLKDAKAMIKALESRVAEHELELKRAMGEASELHILGKRVATWKTSTRNCIDTKRLQLEAPDVYNKYIKQSSSRTFLLK